jgi:hypothetical protein
MSKPLTDRSPSNRATKPCLALAAILALAASLALAACGAASHSAPSHSAAPAPGQTVAVPHQIRSRWPDPANYNAIIVAVKVRDQALHLKMWNQKAYAAQLALGTLVTLEGSMLPGRCAHFVAHLYDELADLSQAQTGEDWQPMFDVVAHDPSAASQCAAPRGAHSGPRVTPPEPAVLLHGHG